MTGCVIFLGSSELVSRAVESVDSTIALDLNGIYCFKVSKFVLPPKTMSTKRRPNRPL